MSKFNDIRYTARNSWSLLFQVSCKLLWWQTLSRLWTIFCKVHDWKTVQVNLFQKLLFWHQLTHNMTTDCSLNYKFSTCKLQAQNMGITWPCMGRTCCVHKLFVFLFWHSAQHVLTMFWACKFSCTELVKSVQLKTIQI